MAEEMFLARQEAEGADKHMVIAVLTQAGHPLFPHQGSTSDRERVDQELRLTRGQDFSSGEVQKSDFC